MIVLFAWEREGFVFQRQRGVYYQKINSPGLVILPPSRSLETPEFGVPFRGCEGKR